MKKNPKVSLLVPTLNRADTLPTLLDSLTKQTYKNFEILIIDGGSTDNTKEILDQYKEKLKIKFAVQKGGLIKQENKGVKLATGDIIMRTDDDAKLPPQVLKEIVKTFQMDDKVGGASGPTITPEMKSRDLFLFQDKLKKGNFLWRLIGKLYYDYICEGKVNQIGKFFRSGAVSLGANFPRALKLKKPIEVDMHECTSMAMRVDLLRKIGGFDEIYGGVGDYNEVDVSFKIRKLGYKILLNPKAAVYHLTSKSGVFSARANSYGRILNFINFYFRHIKPNNLDKTLRFLTYLTFQNGYYTYMFFQQRKLGFLGCYPASIIGLVKNIPKLWSNEETSKRGGG